MNPASGSAAAAGTAAGNTLDMNQFHDVFFEEAEEHLGNMESFLLDIDLAAPDGEVINAVFRAAHSIKGGAGMFGFTGLINLTHEAENLLDRIRKAEVPLTALTVDALLEAADALGAMLAVLRGRAEDAPDPAALVARLRALASGVAPPAAPTEEAYGLFDDEPKSDDSRAYGLFAAPVPQGAVQANSGIVAAPGTARERREKSVESASIRVSVSKVDQLIDLVGELVITQAMLAQSAAGLGVRGHEALQARMVDLERNTRGLQESVMSIRMMPVSIVFNRFPRMMRDLAARLGKQVELRMVGETTELDKGLVEQIADPMTHLVRNAVDHGIEMPEVRVAAGKPAAGSIVLSARHRGGNIEIEVADDGGGLRRDRIMARAAERGIAIAPEAPDAEVWNLIFEPGFSTAEEVTDVSGRGVGMDVVRRNIKALGGSVEISSSPGAGTKMTVRLPLTLAIMDGMSVGIGEDIYILPLGAVVESMRADPLALRPVAGQGRVFEVRGEYLPVLRLADAFPTCGPAAGPEPEMAVIVETDGVKTTLLVDRLIAQHQVVVKSLEANLGALPRVSGATIMGDGRVALILDVAALVRMSRH